MEVNIDIDRPFAVARVSGSLSAADSERFADAVLEYAAGSERALAIDLSSVTEIDSSGLSALVYVVTRARLAQGWVVLVAPPPFVAGVLNITRLDRWFDICDSLEEAAQRLTAA